MVDHRLLLAARGDGFGAGDFDAGVVHDHIEAPFAQAPHEAGAFGGVAEVRDHLLEVGGVADRLCNGLAADGSGVGGGRDERQRADVGGRAGSSAVTKPSRRCAAVVDRGLLLATSSGDKPHEAWE